jgi:hypothetical protein
MRDKVEHVISAALYLAASRQYDDLHPGDYGALCSREMHYDILERAIKDAAEELAENE